MPAFRTIDRGTQFELRVLQQLTELLGIRRVHTTFLHPISSVMVERLHRQLKASLTTVSVSNNWANKLPLVMLGLRTTIKQDIGCCSAELMYGTTLCLLGEIFDSGKRVLRDVTNYVQRLKGHMNYLKITLARIQEHRVFVLHCICGISIGK